MTITEERADSGARLDTELTAMTKEEGKQHQRDVESAMREFLRPVRFSETLGTVLSVVSGLLVAVPYLAIAGLGQSLLKAADEGRTPTVEEFLPGVMLILGALVGRSFLYSLALTITHFADVKVGATIRRDIVRTLARAPLGAFTRTTSGQIAKSVQNDTAQLHYLVAHNKVEVAAAVAAPLACGGVLFYLDWRMALVALLPLPIYFISYARMSAGATEKMAEVELRQQGIASRLVEFIAGSQVVKTFGRAGEAYSAYRREADELGIAYANWAKPMVRMDAMVSMVLQAPVTLALSLLAGGLMVGADWIDPITMLVCTTLAMLLPQAMMTVTNAWWGRRMAKESALRLKQALDIAPLSPVTDAIPPLHFEIEVDNVSFSYGATKALDGVSLVVPQGTTTALVGASGSGKTTLATLIARFHDVQEGAVRIGGVDVRNIPADDIYRVVSFVLQDVALVRDSIRNNIRLGRPDASDEEVAAAARAAQIHDEILALTNGYDTVVGEETSLSGGQAQRVSIARAILADTPILILDEATAFADPESELEIHRALSRLMRGRTVVVIAHRLSSVVNVDQIAVFSQGRIVETGTHEELLAIGDTYASLWRWHAEEAVA